MSEFLPDRDRQPRPQRERNAANQPPAWSVLSVIGGIFCGLVTTAAAAFALFVAVSNSGPRDAFDWMVGLMGLAGAICVGLLVCYVIIGRSLPRAERKQIKRYVIMGFLIGCGIGCLIEGLCFSALKGI